MPFFRFVRSRPNFLAVKQQKPQTVTLAAQAKGETKTYKSINIPDVPEGRLAKDQNGHLTRKLFGDPISKSLSR